MFKKFAIGLVAIGAIGAALALLFQQQVGSAIFERAVEQRSGRDSMASLADGLHIGMCGTGSPFPNPDRAGPCNIVIAGNQMFVVDIGEGGARNLNLMGIPLGKLDGVLLTHFHSDHIDGMGPLMLFHWTQGTATAPLPVYGPQGVGTVVDGFNQAYLLDHGYRIAHHGEAIVPPTGGGAAAMPFTIGANSVVLLEKDGLKITAFPVNHTPVSPAVGFRFDYKGRSIVISGDTAKSASLERAASGADLLVHEALAPNLVNNMTISLDKAGQTNTATITRDILDYHASPEEAAESAQVAGVKQLVLSHLVPPIPSAYFYPAFLGDAAKKFDGPITVGEDGMFFSLPAGGKEIQKRTLF
ncbi:MBL fold metallo-hydrolase [Pontixanthobacter gangjinensis]|uniref:MBL fold metallo-hydrolase n=1 Tax=Pontixanthobacter gangjinensis TaxID=1028742 RepID=A0A6I4SR47_9SPHN|nr:MBL fold metallo-hydrolase [Pontixanthobacter gangjinensis]MXO57347.1 MBL fold metallo-hydrolase [Pontixanthobacter gangjinensis]